MISVFIPLFSGLAVANAYPQYDTKTNPNAPIHRSEYALDAGDFSAVSTAINEAMKVVFAEYPFAHELDEAAVRRMTRGALRGMVEELGDGHSEYMPPRQVAETIEDLSGSYVGVGLRLEDKNDTVVVVTPIKNSPAEQAGVQPGDIIISVDGKPLGAKSATDAVELIRGPEGSFTELELVRADEVITVSVQRATVTLPDVTLHYVNGVPVLSLHQFSPDTAAKVRTIINTQLTPVPDKMVVDVRSNPGGYVQTAIDITEFFLEPEEEIMHLRYREKKEVFKATRVGELAGVSDLRVVINGGSASASEILAGALRDSAGAKLIGNKTYGKGSMQEFFPLKDGMLKLTSAAWYTPSGQWVSALPLVPTVKATDKIETEIDEMLDAATQ